MTAGRMLRPLLASTVLLMAAAPAVAQEPNYGGWVVRTPPPSALVPTRRAVVIERGVAMIKHDAVPHRSGRAGLLLECRNGALALLAMDLDSPPGATPPPVGNIDVKIRIDQADVEAEQWSILGNAYEPPDPKGLAGRFLNARSFALLVPTPLGDRELSFDLEGFATAADEIRKVCPF